RPRRGARPSRCGGERRRHHAADELRGGGRGRLARGAHRPPRRLPENPPNRAADHGGRPAPARPPGHPRGPPAGRPAPPAPGAADAGAYSCAKRAVAALTWQLGAVAPEGVVVNAISPIAVTRMVTAALERARGAGSGGAGGGSTSTAASGGLSLGSMPQPSEL